MASSTKFIDDDGLVRGVAYSVVAGVYAIMATGTTLLFWYRSKSNVALQQRSVILTCVGGVCDGLAVVSFLLKAAIPAEFPCFLLLWAGYLGLIPLYTTFVCRAMRLIFIHRLNVVKRRVEVLIDRTLHPGELAGSHMVRTRVRPLENSPGARSPNGPHSTRQSILSSTITSPRRPSLEEAHPPAHPHRRLDRIFRSYDQATIENTIHKVLASTCAASFIYCMLVTFVTRNDTSNNAEPNSAALPIPSVYCTLDDWEYKPFLVVLSAYFFVLCPLLLVFLWQSEDAFGIQRDLLVTVVFALPCYIMYYIWHIYYQNTYPQWLSFNWFVLGCFTTHISSVVLPLLQELRLRHTVDKKMTRKGFGEVLKVSRLGKGGKCDVNFDDSNVWHRFASGLNIHGSSEATEKGYSGPLTPLHGADIGETPLHPSARLDTGERPMTKLASRATSIDQSQVGTHSELSANSSEIAATQGAVNLWNAFEVALMDPYKRVILDKYSVKAFCAELTRFVDAYQGLKEDCILHWRRGSLAESESPAEPPVAINVREPSDTKLEKVAAAKESVDEDKHPSSQLDQTRSSYGYSTMTDQENLSLIFPAFDQDSIPSYSKSLPPPLPSPSPSPSSVPTAEFIPVTSIKKEPEVPRVSLEDMSRSNISFESASRSSFIALGADEPRDGILRLVDVTSPFVSIQETVDSLLKPPQSSDSLQGTSHPAAEPLKVPSSLRPLFASFYNTFINPSSFLQVNLTSRQIEKIQAQMQMEQYTLDIFDEAKDHVLQLLFHNVVERFARERGGELGVLGLTKTTDQARERQESSASSWFQPSLITQVKDAFKTWRRKDCRNTVGQGEEGVEEAWPKRRWSDLEMKGL